MVHGSAQPDQYIRSESRYWMVVNFLPRSFWGSFSKYSGVISNLIIIISSSYLWMACLRHCVCCRIFLDPVEYCLMLLSWSLELSLLLLPSLLSSFFFPFIFGLTLEMKDEEDEIIIGSWSWLTCVTLLIEVG